MATLFFPESLVKVYFLAHKLVNLVATCSVIFWNNKNYVWRKKEEAENGWTPVISLDMIYGGEIQKRNLDIYFIYMYTV